MAQGSMSIEGQVVSVDATGSLLHLPRSSACGSCKGQSQCGSYLLEADGAQQWRLGIAARPGQRVSLKVPTHQFLAYVAVAYLLIPVATLMGATLSYLSAGGDLAAACGALLGGRLGYSLVKLYDAHRVARPEAIIVDTEGSDHISA